MAGRPTDYREEKKVYRGFDARAYMKDLRAMVRELQFPDTAKEEKGK